MPGREPSTERMGRQPIYRLLSASAILGYGFDEQALVDGASRGVDLIAADAGSMDAGPYYLGSGKMYVEPPALKRDFKIMMQEALRHSARVIVGNCGFAGGQSHLDQFLEIVEEVFEELGVADIKVAVIEGSVDSDLLSGSIHELQGLGCMPEITKAAVQECVCVPQMGVAPLITALNHNARVIFTTRVCDVAIFACDPLRQGIKAGIAYHAGHVLECGALAADPGSGSDCLLAEFFDDDSVEFIAPNPVRVTSPKSVSAHSLYEEPNPWVQHYPEGVLSFINTEYYQQSDKVAGLRGSEFFHREPSLKIEGTRCIGVRSVALLSCDNELKASDQYLIYGLNGVEARPVPDDGSINEIGILIEVKGSDEERVHTLASLLKAGFLHYGFEGRLSTAGNMAYPLSPSSFSYVQDPDTHVTLVVGGSRDPEFIRRYDTLRKGVLGRVKSQHPELYTSATVNVHCFDTNRRLLFIDTIAESKEASLAKQRALIQELADHLTGEIRHVSVFSGDVYVWTLFHITHDAQLIRSAFKIKEYNVTRDGHRRDQRTVIQYAPANVSVGSKRGPTDEEFANWGMIELQASTGDKVLVAHKPLVDMASVIRSKDAGINTLTYDIFFKSDEDLDDAVASNLFTVDAMAKTFDVEPETMIGTWAVRNCRAIKVSRFRTPISGMPGDRDVFGAQQHSVLTTLQIPIYQK
eukprot:Clim_evm21s225 gene=Clim_evmTU21s225